MTEEERKEKQGKIGIKYKFQKFPEKPFRPSKRNPKNPEQNLKGELVNGTSKIEDWFLSLSFNVKLCYENRKGVFINETKW